MITLRSAYEFIAMAAAIAFGLLAYRHSNRIVIAIATAVMATAAATVIWAGQLVFPLVYYMVRRRPTYHLGIALLFAMIATPPILYWRMPWPRPLPNRPTLHAVASVVNLRTVNHVGGGHRTRGQQLRTPFQVATLSFAPVGNQTPLTVVDTVDSGSVPTLRKRGTVDVVYPPIDPAAARVAGASRTYAADLFWYVMEWIYGTTLVVAIVVELLELLRRPFTARRSWRRPLIVREGISLPFGR